MKLCLVSPFPLHPVRGGAARRSMALASFLREQGHEVELFCPVWRIRGPEEIPTQFGWHFFKQPHMILHPFNPYLFISLLRQVRQGSDGIILSFPFQIIPVLLVSKWTRTPFFLDAHNVEHACFFSTQRPFEGLLVFILEWLAVKAAKEVFAVSLDDQALFFRRFGRRTRYAPNGVNTEHFVSTATRPKEISILFFGKLDYRPNRQAVHFINGQLAPWLAQALPQARLLIAGLDPPPLVYAPNVKILGPVARIEQVIADASLVIAPLNARDGGGGTRLKILEAMACGKNVLATEAATQGLPDRIRRAIRIAPLERFGPEIVDFFRGRWKSDLPEQARQATLSLDWKHCFQNIAAHLARISHHFSSRECVDACGCKECKGGTRRRT